MDPVLLSFIAGLGISGYYMTIDNFKTTSLLISSLLFAGIGIVSSS